MYMYDYNIPVIRKGFCVSMGFIYYKRHCTAFWLFIEDWLLYYVSWLPVIATLHYTHKLFAILQNVYATDSWTIMKVMSSVFTTYLVIHGEIFQSRIVCNINLWIGCTQSFTTCSQIFYWPFYTITNYDIIRGQNQTKALLQMRRFLNPSLFVTVLHP